MRHWLDFLFPPRVDEVALREVSTDVFLSLIDARLVPETTPNTVALLPFTDARVRAAMHEAKYHGDARALALLAGALTEYLRDADDVGRRTSYIRLVPVPLGKERLKERGFNQVAEVTRRALHSLGEGWGGAVDPTLLIRTRETASQVSLPRRAREENMRGAFRAAHAADPAYTYIVIDDVMTTGATLQAAIDALKEAGAEHLIPLALAH